MSAFMLHRGAPVVHTVLTNRVDRQIARNIYRRLRKHGYSSQLARAELVLAMSLKPVIEFPERAA